MHTDECLHLQIRTQAAVSHAFHLLLARFHRKIRFQAYFSYRSFCGGSQQPLSRRDAGTHPGTPSALLFHDSWVQLNDLHADTWCCDRLSLCIIPPVLNSKAPGISGENRASAALEESSAISSLSSCEAASRRPHGYNPVPTRLCIMHPSHVQTSHEVQHLVDTSHCNVPSLESSSTPSHAPVQCLRCAITAAQKGDSDARPLVAGVFE